LEEDRLVAAEYIVGAIDVPDLVAHGPQLTADQGVQVRFQVDPV
jgi:hypothetical protein